jgi:hypothetical protein
MICPRKEFLGAMCLTLVLALNAAPSSAVEVTAKDLAELLAQNRSLQQQVEKQQQQIDQLRERLDAQQYSGSDNSTRMQPDASSQMDSPALRAAREIRVSGEVGLVFFSSGSDGAYPNSEFRVDDARIFLEAPVWKNVYFYTGLELTTREAADEYFHVGELYADMEDVLQSGRDYSLSLRVGRFNIPFGEEYQYRDVMANPLISHSVTDIWGIDEGVQAYGSLGRIQYNLAVQNGGHKTLHDYNKDKSVTARLSFDPVKSLHLSVSAHRTGKLDVANDGMSEIWFSNGFFRALGTAATTRTFAASLYEADAIWRWKTGHFQAAGGAARFDDDSTAADNSRHLSFYSFEAMQKLMGKFYGAARYSKLRAAGGYPLVGQGNAGEYFYNPFAPRTTDLERFTGGVGYQFDIPLVWKLEYSWESGHLVGGKERDDTDLLATELGLKF